MADELSRAISFVNGYFVLVDGLVPDLADHLAEDVVLDWFGQTIEGRVNVATFMKDEKISSRHIFNEVNPVTTIGYRRQRSLRRKYYSIGGTHENGNLISIRNENDEDEIDDENHQKKYKRQCFSDGVMMRNDESITDEGSDNIHGMEVEDDSDSECKEASWKMHDRMEKQDILDASKIMECNLNFEKLALEGDKNSTPNAAIIKPKDFLDSDAVNHALNELGNEITLKTEFKSTNVDDIEKKIFQLRNKGVGMPLKLMETEMGQGDGPLGHDETNPIKYIEACGVIEFSRFFNTNQIRKDIRKRFCRLQIAYSVKNKDSIRTNNEINRQPKTMNVNEVDKNEVSSKKSSKLKSLRELRQLSDNLIPRGGDNTGFSTDDDDDYNDDASNERNKFLKKLNLKPMNDNEDGNMNDLVTPKYARHRLTSEKSPRRVMPGGGDTRGFVFNYIIHLIIYESNTKCRLNLSHEFESKELSDD